jgi:transcriptional regulator with XRE-family HTH domain
VAAEKEVTRRGSSGDRREFGRRVRERREALGLRPEELADWLGVTTREVLQLEAGLSEPGSILRQRLRTVLRDDDMAAGPTPLADAVDEFLRKHRQPHPR